MSPNRGAPHSMDNDTAQLARVVFAGHGDVDRRIAPTEAIGEAVEIGGRLVTQHGLRPRSDQGRPSQRVRARRPGEGGVDPSLKVLPPSSSEQRADRSRVESAFDGLRASNDAALQRDQGDASIGDFNGHSFIVQPPLNSCPVPIPYLWKTPPLWENSPDPEDGNTFKQYL